MLPPLSMLTCLATPLRGHNGQSVLYSSSFQWNSSHCTCVPRGWRVPQRHRQPWSVFLLSFYGGRDHWMGINWFSCFCPSVCPTRKQVTLQELNNCKLSFFFPLFCFVHVHPTHIPHTDTKHTCTPVCLTSLALAGGFFTISTTWEALYCY